MLAHLKRISGDSPVQWGHIDICNFCIFSWSNIASISGENLQYNLLARKLPPHYSRKFIFWWLSVFKDLFFSSPSWFSDWQCIQFPCGWAECSFRHSILFSASQMHRKTLSLPFISTLRHFVWNLLWGAWRSRLGAFTSIAWSREGSRWIGAQLSSVQPSLNIRQPFSD